MQTFVAGEYDVVVVGAGHAGCEAALAAARLGQKTLMLTIQLDSIALMACNPSVGGTSKGQIVREVDALGGQMGLCADASALQTRMLNTSKGPAVHSLRAQADKGEYQRQIRRVVENQENLLFAQGECTRILTHNGRVSGIETKLGARYHCRALVLATGVYLRGKVIIGEHAADSGPSGLFPATELTAGLLDLGMKLMRFKTGTPARVHGRSLDYAAMTAQHGDNNCPAFSFLHDGVSSPQQPCYLTWTNSETHRIIRENLHRSPLYSGVIEGTGPRYCPSIEDKVVRFAGKERHQVFIEPEGLHSQEMYVQGMSSSLPVDVQLAMLRTLPGLERVEMMRPGYAIEYDCMDATQLDASLHYRALQGLFCAGQINGSSGYEEAAGQGIIAGINATQYLKGEPPFLVDRSEGYIGVLIDDLVTKGTAEPYRMMTSRAEYRLLLRQDNADLRLTERAYRLGLASEERYARAMKKREETERLTQWLRNTVLPPSERLTEILRQAGETPPEGGVRMAELLRRPAVKLEALLGLHPSPNEAGKEALEQTEIHLKYEGYIERQQQEVERFQRLESRAIPQDIDYSALGGLRIEARQKLAAQRPLSLGQASRISGVSPADMAVLMVTLDQWAKRGKRSE